MRQIASKPTGKIANEPLATTEQLPKVALKPAREGATKPTREVAHKPTTAEIGKCIKGSVQQKSPVIAKHYCLLLDAIPLEIRCMIYDLLLVSDDLIDSGQANKLLGENKSLSLRLHNPISYISAALLRTCRTVYKEGLPILYGRNVFDFSHPEAIRKFRHCGIDEFPRSRFLLVDKSLCNFLLSFINVSRNYSELYYRCRG